MYPKYMTGFLLSGGPLPPEPDSFGVKRLFSPGGLLCAHFRLAQTGKSYGSGGLPPPEFDSFGVKSFFSIRSISNAPHWI
jgi:hypothetical protein